MKILVAGSNQNGNDLAKQEVIEKLREAGHEVYHTCEVYRSNGSGKPGDDAVTKTLLQCDVYYIVCTNGYAGDATGLRLGMAEIHPTIEAYSSQKLSKPDFVNHVDPTHIQPVEQLIEYLKLDDFRSRN